MNRSVGERQRWAWAAAGMSAVTAACLCGAGWLWVLLGAAAACAYYYYLDRFLPADGFARTMTSELGLPGKVLAVFLLFWLIVTMGWCAALAGSAFPTVNGFPGLGMVLLALAAWGCRAGARACAGCSGILCLFLAALYSAIALFALPDVELDYLRPDANWPQLLPAAGLLILPAAVWAVPVQEKVKTVRLPAILLPLCAAALAAVTAGVLSPELAAVRPVPVYDLAQSVSVLGVVERIEPLLSAAMTMGIFSLLCAQTAACGELAEGLGMGNWSAPVCCLAAAGTMFLARAIPIGLFSLGNLAFLGLLPALCSLFGRKSKGE